MAVDALTMRKDLFDLVTMFGPANAGGPAQSNTNPGASGSQPAQLPAPPDPEATGSVPQPQGVKPLPQGTPIEANVPAGAKVPPGPQGGSPQQGPIELLPGDADPNLLPPEIRDSWMFRYQQAQRAAQYKQAEEEAKWQNVVGGVGNIAQIVSGQRPTYQQGSAHAKEPGATDVGTLYSWKKDYDTAQATLAAQQKLTNLVSRLQKEHPELSPAAIEALSRDEKTLAQYGFNQADAKAIADAAKAQIDVVKGTQDLAGKDINSDEVINDMAKSLGGISPNTVRAMPINERIAAYKQITAAREQSAAGERTKIAGKDIEEAKKSNSALERTLVRNAAARGAIESGAGITGGGFTESEIEQTARRIAMKFGIDRGAVQNDSVVSALLAQNAIDMSQDMKGSLSDRDMQLLAKASAGDINLTADEKSRIIAMNDIATRRQIDKNNDSLTRAGERIGEDRKGEVSKPNPMTQAELREIDPAIAREIIRNPENGYKLAVFQYGKTTADELVGRAEEVITSRLMVQKPQDSRLKTQAGQARTQLDKDADTALRTSSVDTLVANRDRIIQQLNAMDPNQNGAATFELILEAKQAGKYGVKP